MPSRFLQTTAWVLEAETLKVVDSIITARLVGRLGDMAVVNANTAEEYTNKERHKPYEVVDGVAVISMNGVIGKRMGMFDAMSGGVSTQRIQMQIEDALTDPSIVAVVMSTDSPGGTVDGTAELADWILANRGVKPVHAYADGTMASGAYWVGAACDRITAYRTARIGSVSAVICHYDRSQADVKAGIKRTFITSGEYKRIANDAEPLSAKGEAYLQDTNDRYHAMFVEGVAAGRGMTPEEVQEKFGNAKVHLAAEALEIGMIDAIGSLAETINAARAAAQEEGVMDKAELAEKFPKLHAELIEEGRAAAQVEFEGQVKEQGDALVAAEQERMCGLYGSLHGTEAQAGFATLVGSGMNVNQVDAMIACGFGKGSSVQVPTGGDQLKQKILDDLEEDNGAGDLNNGGGDGGETDFMAAVDSLVATTQVTRIEAMKTVARTHPELHKAYLQPTKK